MSDKSGVEDKQDSRHHLLTSGILGVEMSNTK